MNKLRLLLPLFVLVALDSSVLSLPLLARQRVQGFCEQGAMRVITSGLRSTTNVQGSFPNCTVTVRKAGTLTNLTIYADDNGTPLANPFTANNNGYWFFYVDDGRVDVQLSGGGLPAPWTLGDVQVRDTALNDVASPVYLWAHFRDDDSKGLRFSYGRDGLNWRDLNNERVYTTPGGGALGFRDPSVYEENGIFYIAYSPSGSPDFTTIHLLKTTDFITVAEYATIQVADYLPTAGGAWAPEWFKDPVSGNVYLMVGCPLGDGFSITTPFQPLFLRVNPATGAVLSSHLITVNGTTSPKRTFDFFNYYDAATAKYYLFYVDQTQTGDNTADLVDQPIVYATASSLLGPYNQVPGAGVDYFGFDRQADHGGYAGAETEGVHVFDVSADCVRIQVDRFVLPPVGNGSGGRQYFQEYKDSCRSLGAVFSTGSITPIVAGPANKTHVSQAEHGTVIKLDPVSVGGHAVMTAAAYYDRDGMYNSPFGINTQAPPYTFSVAGRAVAPGFIAFNEAVTVAASSGGGQWSTWTSCTTSSNGCALAEPGEGRWYSNFDNDGDEGQVQLSNSTHQEASMLFGTGVRQFGRRPLSVGRNGDRGLWTVGTNKLAYTSGTDRFFVYNRGLGTSPAITGQTLGTQGNGSAGCYGMKFHTGANPVYVTHLGRWIGPGNIGNHKMYILDATGAVLTTYTLDMTTAGSDGTGYYAYVPITNGLLSYYMLAAGTDYFIMSTEPNSDKFYQDNTSVTVGAGVGSVTSAASGACNGSAPVLSGGAGKSFGPVNFMYSAGGAYGGVVVSVENSGTNEGAVHLTYGLTFGSGQGSSYNTTNYGSIDTFGSLPGPAKRINMGTGVLGSADADVYAGSFNSTKVSVGTGVNPSGWQSWIQNPNAGQDTVAGIIANAGHAAYLNIGIYGANMPFLMADSGSNMYLNSGNGLIEEFFINRTSGAVVANWGLVLRAGTEGSYTSRPAYASIDAYGSGTSGVKRINFGTGVLGTSDAWGLMGRLRVGQGLNPAGETMWVQDMTGNTVARFTSSAGLTTLVAMGVYGEQNTFSNDPNGDFRLTLGSTGSNAFMMKRSVAAGHFRWGVTLGDGTNGTNGAEWGSIDSFGSFAGPKRINFGTGTLGSSDALLLAKSIDLSGYIGRRGGSNSDLAGFVTLDGAGAASRAFTNATQMTNATCVCTVNSSLAACQNFISGGALQLRGPAGANVTYVCIGAEF